MTNFRLPCQVQCKRQTAHHQNQCENPRNLHALLLIFRLPVLELYREFRKPRAASVLSLAPQRRCAASRRLDAAWAQGEWECRTRGKGVDEGACQKYS